MQALNRYIKVEYRTNDGLLLVNESDVERLIQELEEAKQNSFTDMTHWNMQELLKNLFKGQSINTVYKWVDKYESQLLALGIVNEHSKNKGWQFNAKKVTEFKRTHQGV